MCLEFNSAGSYLPCPGFFVQSQCKKQIIISSINTKENKKSQNYISKNTTSNKLLPACKDLL